MNTTISIFINKLSWWTTTSWDIPNTKHLWIRTCSCTSITLLIYLTFNGTIYSIWKILLYENITEPPHCLTSTDRTTTCVIFKLYIDWPVQNGHSKWKLLDNIKAYALYNLKSKRKCTIFMRFNMYTSLTLTTMINPFINSLKLILISQTTTI